MRFTLYNLNSDFWARVVARARAEGTTVKAVILRLLTQWLGVLALAAGLLVTIACGPKSPSEPSPTVQATVTPITIDCALVGVLPCQHPAPPEPPPYVAICTDPTATNQGQPPPCLYPAPRPPAPPPSDPGPGPSPAPPPYQPPPPTFTASVSCAPTPGAIACNAYGTWGGSTQDPSTTTNVDWSWGDGAVTLGGGWQEGHAYVLSGQYTITVIVTADTPGGSKTATASKAYGVFR